MAGALELVSQTAKKKSVRENFTEGCITPSLVVSLIDDAYNRVE